MRYICIDWLYIIDVEKIIDFDIFIQNFLLKNNVKLYGRYYQETLLGLMKITIQCFQRKVSELGNLSIEEQRLREKANQNMTVTTFE